MKNGIHHARPNDEDIYIAPALRAALGGRESLNWHVARTEYRVLGGFKTVVGLVEWEGKTYLARSRPTGADSWWEIVDIVEAPVRCEDCGGAFKPSLGYYEAGEYAYCVNCCRW